MDLGHDGGGDMPMPISSSYASLHESAKLKMLTSGNGTGTAGADDMNANNAGVGAGVGVGVGVGVQQQQQQQLLRPLASLDNSSSNTPSKALVPSPGPGLGVVGGQPVGLGGVGVGVGVGVGGVQVVGVSPAPPPLVGGGGSAVVVAAAAAGAAAGGAGGGGGGGGGKKAVRYRECHKNHAASIGGHAIDGCGEFMPSGEEGTLESLKCAACDCHRNFHRREVEGEQPACDCHLPPGLRAKDRKRSSSVGPVGVGGGGGGGGGPVGGGVGGLSTPSPLPLPSTLGIMPSRPPAPILMALSTGPADSDDQEGGLGSASPAAMKKRFRTKFSTEQKEKMCTFADKLGWKIQKHDEAAVQQFCADVGVKRHVLKVWMHNNKHTLGKKL